MFVYSNNGACSRNHCCSGKTLSITYSECVFVALVIQHAKRKRHIILSYLACLALPYFSALSHKRFSGEKVIKQKKMCLLMLPTIYA